MRGPLIACLCALVAADAARATAAPPAPARAAAPAAPAAPTTAPAPPNPTPPPAPAEIEAPPSKGGPRPLMSATPRPGQSANIPKPPRAAAERDAWLKAQLDDVFGASALAKAKISAIVVDADTGKTIYARGEKTQLNAASNVKIVTGAASLSLLGPEYRWRTTLAIVGPPSGPPLPAGGEVAGDLYLRGAGDPTFATEDLSAMVSDLAALGLHKVRGALVVDESLFEGGVIPPAYDQRNDSTASRAPASAASLNGNVVAVTIIPGAAAGASARVVVDPPSPYFVIAGRVVTSAGGPLAPAVDTKEEGTHTRVNVAGRIRLGSDPRTFYRRVSQPSLFLGTTLKQLLDRRGISVGSGARRKGADAGAARAGGARLGAARGRRAGPQQAVEQLRRRTDVRTLGAEIGGRPGTWEKGLKAVDRYLTSVGVKTGSYQMQNGSGLYDSNRFSAEQIVAVLRAAARDFRISAEFLASLAVAGTDGTIAHRMGGTLAERYVRAKTGTLANVSCLSGFAGSPGHTPLVFSIIVNDVPSATDARRAQDRAAEILVAYLEGDANSKP